VIDILERDPSFFSVGASSIIIGYFDGGWGLSTFILVLLLALKYMDSSLFLFPFCFVKVLNAASTTTASFAKVLGEFSPCYSSPSSFAVFVSVSTISGNICYFSC